MTLSEFHNGLRILLNIDFDDLATAGVMDDVGQSRRAAFGEWILFRQDPFRWFIRCDDEKADKIWKLIENRMPRKEPTGK
mgnify:CR=1 FL=1